jgi:signal transduction histidine kinase
MNRGLDFRSQPAVEAESLPALRRLDDDKVNILLIDDKPGNLLALEAILEGLDQNLGKATSGPEALRCLLDDDFAVILLDVHMPDMDGFETAELIRSRERSRHTPIIFLTAYEEAEVQMFKGYALGAVDYLCKPIVPAVLRSKVSAFVDLKRMANEIQRQALLLRENERREHERVLQAERQRWEMDRLRAEAAHEKKIAEDLAESDRRKDEFLAMLGHELRNPMAPILNALHVMRLNASEPAVLTPMRDLIERQVRHMSRLVDDLLDVSRITRGQIQLRKSRVLLDDAVSRAIESSRPLIDARRHQLHTQLPAHPIWLEADLTRLEQMVSNLLINAAKYMEDGGQIWLDVQPTKDRVIIRVRDTGIGMAPEMLPKVFDLFMQADRSLDRSQGGLGIGLTLVRRLVEMHCGSITAFSPGFGQGSEFTLQLPILPDAEAPQAGATQTPSVTAIPHRVLIVDDNADVAISLAVLLELDGHQVKVIHDGQRALEACREHHPDVIFLDIGLPGKSGYEVARELRAAPETKDALLVAITGYGQDQDRHRCHDAGFDLHLIKPVDPALIREMLAFPNLTGP